MKTSYIFGDSIGQGIYFQEENGRYRRSRRNCVQQLKENGIPVENHAMMGYTIARGLKAFRESEIRDGGNCVIEFGGNDCDLDWAAVAEEPDTFHDGKVPLNSFRQLLREFIREARQRGMTPMLVTPPPLLSDRYYRWVSRNLDEKKILQYLGDVEHISRWQERYAWAVRDAAEEEGCRLIDLRRILLEERDLPDLMSRDGIHPNEQGYDRMAERLLEVLRREEMEEHAS